MTRSLLSDCLLLRDQPIEKMIEYLHSINIRTFDKIIKESSLEFEPKNTVLYILAAYSEESPLVIPRQDSKAEQENICEYLQIPEIYRHNLINLKNKEVRIAATNYVTQFAGPLHQWLMFARIQYQYFEQVITNRDFATQDEADNDKNFHYDIKEHGKTIIEMERLAKKINQIEKEIKQDTKKLEALQDMEEWKDKGKGKGKGGQRVGNIENAIP